jgi:small redox-active disulfide protein 2
MIIKVLGTGCAKCANLEQKTREVIAKNNIEASVEKVSDLPEIMKYGVMMTPALVINEKVVHYGSVPKEDQILKLIQGAM